MTTSSLKPWTRQRRRPAEAVADDITTCMAGRRFPYKGYISKERFARPWCRILLSGTPPMENLRRLEQPDCWQLSRSSRSL